MSKLTTYTYTVNYRNTHGQHDWRAYEVTQVELEDGFLKLGNGDALVAIFAPGEWNYIEAKPAPQAKTPAFCTAHESDADGVMRQVMPDVRANGHA